MTVLAIILTRNEEKHIARAISSLSGVVDEIFVIDCFSDDATVEIATALGATVLSREWTNHADQFNWALTKIPPDTTWIIRIDADEYLTDELSFEIRQRISKIPSDVYGVFFNRRMAFQGRIIRYGGVFPTPILRMFRFGFGFYEKRLMDEHLVVSGKTIRFKNEFIDDNLNVLSWWIDKHNRYASLEAVEVFKLKVAVASKPGFSKLQGSPSVKRWIKSNIYLALPCGFRAFIYFLYRYFFCFGFLDGRRGASFHILQGFWYRYLVDLKVQEVEDFVRINNVSYVEAIFIVLGIEVDW